MTVFGIVAMTALLVAKPNWLEVWVRLAQWQRTGGKWNWD
jgi:hypothetical protein